MAQIIKIGKMYYSDYTEKCTGSDCPTPLKPHPHWHRRRKRLSTDQSFATIKLGDKIKSREAVKRGEMVINSSWVSFKERYLEYSDTKNSKTQGFDRLMIKRLEAAYAITEPKQISVERLDGFKGKLLALGLSHTTVNRYLQAAKAMLHKAIVWRVVVDPGYDEVKPFKVAQKGRVKFYTVKELKLMRQKFNRFWETVTMLGFYAGLRREEMHSLPVAALDFRAERLSIEPIDDFIPKDYEQRFVPMPKPLMQYLKQNINGSKYVLGDNRPTLNTMSKQFTKLVKKLKLTGSLHTLRHSYGAHNAMAGVSIRKLKEWLGHSSIKTTEIYSHLSPEHLAADRDRLPLI